MSCPRKQSVRAEAVLASDRPPDRPLAAVRLRIVGRSPDQGLDVPSRRPALQPFRPPRGDGVQGPPRFGICRRRAGRPAPGYAGIRIAAARTLLTIRGPPHSSPQFFRGQMALVDGLGTAPGEDQRGGLRAQAAGRMAHGLHISASRTAGQDAGRRRSSATADAPTNERGGPATNQGRPAAGCGSWRPSPPDGCRRCLSTDPAVSGGARASKIGSCPLGRRDSSPTTQESTISNPPPRLTWRGGSGYLEFLVEFIR